ncbi:MAG: C1 family peptidase [Armatimonadetes bacterium]|nr:C1 family peptidase [Armatimonadota bacterium]
MATKPVVRARRATPNRNGNGKPPSKEAASITQGALDAFQRSFESDPKNRLALNAVTKTAVASVASNRRAVIEANHVFSHTIKVGQITSQNRSGRCWMFAGLNPMRVAAIKAMNTDDKFEISQNYTMFWDKLEKSNYFLESIIKTVKEPIGSRLLDHLLASPIQDGGQWDMFVNLIRKYGVVPKSAMPESDSSSNTGTMNSAITRKLREYASKLRKSSAKGVGADAVRREKRRMLEEVYRMLAIHLGEPPKEFYWQWRDKDGEFHRDGMITPQAFFTRHVNDDIDAKICLIHCPQSGKSMNTLYTIEYLGNVVEGEIIKYLNVDLKVIKKAAIEMISAGESVWFGCDVGKMLDRDLGVLDMDLFDYETLYGTKFGLDKASRLDYGDSQMTHAMVFAGVDMDERGKPTKWRVENSWGDKGEGNGFLTMTDDWFDQFVYEVAVDRKYLPQELLPILKNKPVALPPWDPMGALAL